MLITARRSRPIRTASLLVSILFTVQIFRPAVAFADSCRAELEDAERKFLSLNEDKVKSAHVTVLELIAQNECEGVDLRDAQILRARCEVFQQSRAPAIDAFCLALCEDPVWTPPENFFDTEKAIFHDALETRPCSCGSPGGKWYWNPSSWKYWTGIAAVGGLLAFGVAALGGSESSEPPPGTTLDDFPPPPGP